MLDCTQNGIAQFMPQPPGPLAWLHDAQGLGMAGADCVVVVAKTDNNLSSSGDWHEGHCACVPERTRASNLWPHALQAYS